MEDTPSSEPDWVRRSRVESIRKRVFGGELLTVNDAAEVLGIHARTVGEYIRDGRLKAFQLGGAWRITEDDLEKFVGGLRAGERSSGGKDADPKTSRRAESLRGDLYGIGIDDHVTPEQLLELAAARADKVIPQLHGIGMKGPITAEQLLALSRGRADKLIAQLHGIGMKGPITAAQLVELVEAGGADAIYPLYAMEHTKPLTAERLLELVTAQA